MLAFACGTARPATKWWRRVALPIAVLLRLTAACTGTRHSILALRQLGGLLPPTPSLLRPRRQDILLRGGRVKCVCVGAGGCGSAAFGNKLIAMVVADEIYEKYLR